MVRAILGLQGVDGGLKIGHGVGKVFKNRFILADFTDDVDDRAQKIKVRVLKHNSGADITTTVITTPTLSCQVLVYSSP